MRKHPGFATTAVLMLAVGLGVNSAVFTVVNAALFRGVPLVHQSDRILRLTTNKDFIYYPDFEEWRDQAHAIKDAALVRGMFHTLSYGDGVPETSFTTETTANLFRMLNVRPMLGRDFSEADMQPSAAPVVILRYDVWARRFRSKPSIVGQTVRIDGLPTTIIGVMPQGFSFPSSQALWTPLIPTAPALRRETGYAQYAYARMGDGAKAENVRVQLQTVGRRLASAFPGTNASIAPVVEAFDDWFIGGNARLVYRAMWGAVGFLLLIVCANVANLLIEQGVRRSHEISIRMALGAGTQRIICQCLAESLTLSILGGGAAWWLARAALRIYSAAQAGNDMPLDITMGGAVLCYLIAISICTGFVVGFITGTHLAGLNINESTNGGGRGISGNKRSKRLSDFFVAGEMVLAVALLAIAAIIVRSFLKVYTADIGVNTVNILTMGLNIPIEKYPNREVRTSFYRDLKTSLLAIPQVESVGFGSAAPGDPTPTVTYELAEAPSAGEGSRGSVAELVVSIDYFRTLEARIVSGRQFGDSDRASSVPVAIVNQQFARYAWPDNPVGKHLRVFPRMLSKRSPPWLTVVGVVSDILQNDHTRQAFTPLVYVPDGQNPLGGFAFVRSNGNLQHLADEVRRQVYAMDPNLPLPVLWPLSERLERAYAFERNVTGTFMFLAGVALLVASMGLYAVVSHSVSMRTQEIGIRIALGAMKRDVVRLIFTQAILPVGSGLVIGLVIAFAASQVLRSQLVGVSPGDPVSVLASSAVLVLCAGLGCWMPARRAMRVDPALSLKSQ